MHKFLNKILPKLYGFYFNVLALFSKKKAAEKTFEVFSTIRRGKVLPKQQAYLEVAKHEVLETCGHQLQIYRWTGNKDRVLLVHGWESNSFRWRNLIATLRANDYDIVAFDAPGHGNSSGKHLHLPLYSDCIHEIIKTYSPKHLIGHSFGGMAILFDEFKRSKSDTKKIVTIGSPSEFKELLAHYQNLVGFNNQVLKAFKALVVERFGHEVQDFSSSRFVKNNTKKGLLIHDELDKLAPFHASEQVHADWQDSTFIRTKGLGHSLHQQHINERIVGFLNL